MSKILVVDDDRDILSLMKMLLSTNGYEVETISRGEETYNKVEQTQPDLVILDIMLAGLDGRDICLKLKEDEKTMHIPVIMFSANNSLKNSIGACKANQFIGKPFDIQHMLDTIDQELTMN